MKEKGKAEVLTSVPEWANTTAISMLLGKSTRRIQQLTQDGLLKTEIPPGGGARKYRTCETVRQFIAHVEHAAEAAGDKNKQADLELKKLAAEVALKESQGQLHRLKTAIAEGKYLLAEQASEELATFFMQFQRFANNIPSRIAGTLAGYVAPETVRPLEKSLQKELDAMIHTFLDAMREKEE